MWQVQVKGYLLQSRPFGVALLFAGIDEKGPQLWVFFIIYLCDQYLYKNII